MTGRPSSADRSPPPAPRLPLTAHRSPRFDQLDPARSRLDLYLAAAVADPPGDVIPGVAGHGHLEIGLDLSARGLDVHLGAERGRHLQRHVARTGLDAHLPNFPAEIG